MDLVFFGIQGSGKGTQSALCTKKYDLHYFETGGELRKLAKSDSPLGKKIKTIIESGNLVPTEVVMDIVANFVSEHNDGKSILFDGIPRSAEQAEQFNALMKKLDRSFKGLLINLPVEKALERLTTRRICPVCKKAFPASYESNTCNVADHENTELVKRKDDNVEAIKTRLEVYEEQTMPIINEYKGKDMLIDVDGDQSIEAVSNDIFTALDKIYQ